MGSIRRDRENPVLIMDGHPATHEVMQRHCRAAQSRAGATGLDAILRAFGTERQGFGENPVLAAGQGVIQRLRRGRPWPMR